MLPMLKLIHTARAKNRNREEAESVHDCCRVLGDDTGDCFRPSLKVAGQAHPQAASLISIRLRILRTGCRAPTKVCSYPCVSSMIKLTRASGPLNPFRSSRHCMKPVLSLVRAVHMLTPFPASVSRPRSEVIWGKSQCLFTMAESSCWHCPKSCRTEHLLRLHMISAKLTVWYRRSLNCIAPVCSQGCSYSCLAVQRLHLEPITASTQLASFCGLCTLLASCQWLLSELRKQQSDHQRVARCATAVTAL